MSNLVTFIFMVMYPSWTSVFISTPRDKHGQIMNANGLTGMLSVMDCVLLCSYQSNNMVFLAGTKCPRWESNNIYVHTKCLKIYTAPTTMLLVMKQKDNSGLGF